MCVVFFNVPPGNKDALTPNPLTKEESRRVYKCDDTWGGLQEYGWEPLS